jgi:putative addiction module component (TIGR02574 family)
MDLAQITQMSVDDKLRLAEAIWDSIEADEPKLTAPQKAELERRLAEYKAHPEQVIPWEQVKAEALARLRK